MNNKLKVIVTQYKYKFFNRNVCDKYFKTPKSIEKYNNELKEQYSLAKQIPNGSIYLHTLELSLEQKNKYSKIEELIKELNKLQSKVFAFNGEVKVSEYEKSIFNKKYSFARVGSDNSLTRRKQRYVSNQNFLVDKQNNPVYLEDISFYHVDKIISNLEKTIKIYNEIYLTSNIELRHKMLKLNQVKLEKKKLEMRLSEINDFLSNFGYSKEQIIFGIKY